MSDNLQVNKIFGALLATGLVVMGARVGVDALFDRPHPEKPGYAIDVVEAAGAGAAAAVEVLPDWGTVLATADLAAGETVFKKCTSCHNIAPGGPNMTGPNLNGLVGRPVASHAGFSYSEGMVAHKAEAPVWSYDALYHFIGNPAKVVKGTKMVFVGVKKPEDRVALIAYLRSMGSTGYAIPAPDPSRQPGAAPAADASASAASSVAAAGASASTAPVASPAPAAAAQ
jgi:cytochrome c